MSNDKRIIIYLLLIGLFLSGIIGFEVWRWQVFQEATNNTVPFWKYVLLFSK